ncbi:hypothetical protein [Halostagnicola bangensis]
MPEDNRFAGLGDAVEDETPETESAGDRESTDSGADDGGVELEHEEDEMDEEPEPEPDPTAFPFDDTTKKTVYVRPETVDDLEDAQALVDAQLRTEHDVRNLTGREFYDAAFRLAAADTDGLIDEILSERERDEN